MKNHKIFFYISLTFLITKLLFIRFGNISAYLFVYFLPGFSSMRSITRIINIDLLFFAIAATYVFSKIFKKETWLTIILFIIFLGLFITDNYFKPGKSYRTKKEIAYNRINPLVHLLKDVPEESVISYEPEKIENPVFQYQIDAMLVSQTCNLKTINGYSGNSPGEYSAFWHEINADSRNYWLTNMNLKPDTLYVITSKDKYELVLK